MAKKKDIYKKEGVKDFSKSELNTNNELVFQNYFQILDDTRYREGVCTVMVEFFDKHEGKKGNEMLNSFRFKIDRDDYTRDDVVNKVLSEPQLSGATKV